MKLEIVAKYTRNSINDVPIVEWHQYPVWLETDNWQNEDEVAPWINSHLFSYRGGVCYVHSRFILKNHTEYEGFVRISAGLVTAIFISVGGKNFVGHSLSENTRQVLNDTKERLAILLGLNVEEVFPISYKCFGKFADAPNLSGIIEE